MPMYVLAQPAGTKRAQCYEVKRQPDGSMLGIVPDHTKFHEKVVVRIAANEIIIPLGDNPPVGRVYGTLIEPVINHWIVNGWGHVYNHVRGMSRDLHDRIGKSLLSSKRAVKRLYPTSLVDDIITEVRAEQGTTLATYAYKSNGTDTLTLRPSISIGQRELVKVASHEMGHNVWFRAMTPEQRAAWIRLYGRYVHVREVSVRNVQTMIKDIRRMGNVRDYVKDVTPEEQAAADIYFKWLDKVHGIDERMLQDCISAGSAVPMPDVHLHRSDKDTPVTLYSKSNPAELFCEALSSFVVNDLNDKRLCAMVQGNLRAAG